MISGRGSTATWSRASRICRMAFVVAFIVLLMGEDLLVWMGERGIDK